MQPKLNVPLTVLSNLKCRPRIFRLSAGVSRDLAKKHYFLGKVSQGQNLEARYLEGMGSRASWQVAEKAKSEHMSQCT